MAAWNTARLGQTVRFVLPSSGACLHMRVAAVVRQVRILEAGAQIPNEDGSEYGFRSRTTKQV